MNKFGWLVIMLWLLAGTATAQPYFVGPDKCESCHGAEVGVWEKTRHAKSFRTIHKSDKAKALMAAVGTAKSMKKDPLCISCHFSLVQKKPGAKPRAEKGPSCESCHGPASEWIDIHNDYGGDDVTAETEPAAHRAQRLAAAAKAGMIGGFDHLGVAGNCFSCHGLSRDDLTGEQLASLYANDHPLNKDFELVRYSQGSVRHRFYPPNMDENAQMTPAQLSRLYVIGKAAQVLAARAAIAKASDGDFKTAQQGLEKAARSALKVVASEPVVAAFLKNPGQASARRLADGIAEKDLSGKLAGQLPDPGDYK